MRAAVFKRAGEPLVIEQRPDPVPGTGEVIVKENEMITHDQARKIEQMGLDKILVRSPMTCQAPLGVCRLCYGMDLATGNLVEEGMAVGIIAAQSIGEPGTQLTMRTFHIGGAAQLAGQSFMAISAGPMFKFNEAISLLVDCQTS